MRNAPYLLVRVALGAVFAVAIFAAMIGAALAGLTCLAWRQVLAPVRPRGAEHLADTGSILR
jgi:hypothetical protein